MSFTHTIACLLHIALWSQLGVLSRIYLAKFFTDGCSGGWGVCLLTAGIRRHTFGAYFEDLASNMLGSFLMGVLVASSVEHMPAPKAVAMLPFGHPWQDAPELFVGLRTGYCGSLTTFASWEFSLVLLLVGGSARQGGQWAEFLWGLIVGMQMSISSFAFGCHCASGIERWIWREGAAESARIEEGEAPGDKARRRQRRIYKLRQLCEHVHARSTQAQARRPEPWSTLKALQHPMLSLDPSQAKHAKTDACTAAALLVLTALWAVLAGIDNDAAHAARRQQWFAILLAPFGAALRWWLTGLHGKLPCWAWLPLGTLTANLAACGIDFGLQAALQRAPGLGYWPRLMFGAIRVGFSGALSTVSTFVAEVYKALDMWPHGMHAYLYTFLTLGLGALSGIVIYGWSVWA